MIPWWLRNLGSGFLFLFIDERAYFFQSKRVIEFFAPTIFSLIYLIIYLFQTKSFSINILQYFDEKLFGIFSFMVPFHLAALAILASIRSDTLDAPLAGQTAFVKKWSNENQAFVDIELKLREYISLLIGYLCSIGILYITVSIFVNSIYIVISNEIFTSVYLFLLVWFFVHYMIMSYYAIYFIINKFN